jgi:hypothetical protein
VDRTESTLHGTAAGQQQQQQQQLAPELGPEPKPPRASTRSIFREERRTSKKKDARVSNCDSEAGAGREIAVKQGAFEIMADLPSWMQDSGSAADEQPQFSQDTDLGGGGQEDAGYAANAPGWMSSSSPVPVSENPEPKKKGGKKKKGRGSAGPSWMGGADSVVEPAQDESQQEDLPDWLKKKNAEEKQMGDNHDDDDADDLAEGGSRVAIAVTERSGYLQKKNKRGRWQKRYFKIEGGALVYFTDERAKKKKGSFMISDFDHITRTGSEMRLSAEGSNKKNSYVYELKADNDDEAVQWIEALKSNHNGMGKGARSCCFWAKKRCAKYTRYLLMCILVVGSLTDMSLKLSQNHCPKGQSFKQWVMLGMLVLSMAMSYDLYSHKGRFSFSKVWIAVCAVATLAGFVILIEGAVNAKEAVDCKVPVNVVEGIDACLASAWLLLLVLMWKQPKERRFNKI